MTVHFPRTDGLVTVLVVARAAIDLSMADWAECVGRAFAEEAGTSEVTVIARGMVVFKGLAE